MKFGQLTEHNKSIIFIEKSYAKCGRQSIPRPFSKIEQIFGSIILSFMHFFYCKPSWGLSKYTETFTSYKAFEVLLPHLMKKNNFDEKYLSYYILLTDQIYLSECLYFVGYWTISVL